MPAHKANEIPNRASLKTVLKIKKPIKAPIGSAKPDANEIIKAFLLLFVA